MILYHGSYIPVSAPDVIHSRDKLDFGKGFYTTPLLEQAERWCSRFIRRGKAGIVSQYSFDENALKVLKVKDFLCYSEEWLDYILTCRIGEDRSDYDIVIGGVANDKVFNTVELYFDGLIGKEEAIKRLRYEKPNLQICFRNQAAIDKYLRYEGSRTI